MNDDDLRRVLRNSLGGRQAPEGVKARVLARLRRRPIRVALPIAAALLAGLALAALIRRPAPLPDAVAAAFDQHARSEVFGHAATAASASEVSDWLADLLGRPLDLPVLRDAGLSPREAHRCTAAGPVHVVYANSWMKLSCFLLDPGAVPPAAGERRSQGWVEGAVFTRGRSTAVAVRGSGVLKIWVADLPPDQLSAIALDAEVKRGELKTTVFRLPDNLAGPAEGILKAMPGVEDCQPMGEGSEVAVMYDRRRVTVDEMSVMLVGNGIEARPRE